MSNADDITRAQARPQTLVDGWQQLTRSAEWQPGLQLGPYRLKQRLGQGGMGVVWLAEQLHPLQRDVAIKVLTGDRRDALAEAWFEIERQALAQLSHRGIAQIYDAGRLPDGALFFAMEYVPGVPLDEFQARHRLDARALARLFVQLCAAVQHAHQRGLIHRDLKPLNVLVQQLDGESVPKIIDFGIAVASLPDGNDGLTVYRAVGTPAYMSPEQRQPGDGGIDARCDIYALGVMLAEALCRAAGASNDDGAFKVSGVHAAVRMQLGEQAAGGQDAQMRARLQACPRELLAIAAKAMADDREQRYESAAALADDLVRWLASRPVRAVGNARLYVLGCLIRRNRVASVAVVLIMLAVLLGSALAWSGMNAARRAQALAEKRRNDAEQLIQFMLGDFADKLRPIGRLDLLDSIGGEALSYLSAQNASSDATSALNRARALRTLGEVQVTRQQFEQATATLASAAELLTPWTAVPDVARVEQLFEAGQIAYYRGLIAYRKRDLAAAGKSWQEYLQMARAFAELTPDRVRGAREIAYALTNLGTLEESREQFEQALKYLRGAAEIRRGLNPGAGDADSLDLANNLSWMASVYNELGQPQTAWRLGNESLELLAAFGRDHPDHAGRRQREINYRLVQAQLALTLDHLTEARELLDGALSLAQVDVTNDPTQPRRKAMLARIAFTLSRLWPPGAADGRQTLDSGATALADLPPESLSKAERLPLDALHCVAQLYQTPAAADCAERELLRLTGPDSDGADRFDLAVRAVELFQVLSAKDPVAAKRSYPDVVSLLDSVPPARRNKLRYLQLQSVLLDWSNPGDARLSELDKRIQAMRAPLTDIQDELP